MLKNEIFRISRRNYLRALLDQDPDWIRQSMQQPSPSMARRPVLITLHAVALRRLTGSACLHSKTAPQPELTREQAMSNFKTLVDQYGLQWTATVPSAAYKQLAKCTKVLTTSDRREALGYA